MQFHKVQLEGDVKTALLTHSEEGNGICSLQSTIACALRVVARLQKRTPTYCETSGDHSCTLW